MRSVRRKYKVRGQTYISPEATAKLGLAAGTVQNRDYYSLCKPPLYFTYLTRDIGNNSLRLQYDSR